MGGKSKERKAAEKKRDDAKAAAAASFARRPRACRFPDCKVPPVAFPDVEIDGRIETWGFCGPHADQYIADAEVKLYKDAREDFNLFAELVGTDDESGKPIKQAPIHMRWAQLADLHDRLIIWSHVECGKTTNLSIFRTIWELGRDTRLRFVILSDTSGQATKIVKAIASMILTNEAVHRIFPDLKPDPKGSWTTTELQVMRPNNAKDPSVRAVGANGALTGGRVDRLIIDDLLAKDNTDTPANREKLESWVRSTALGRLTKNARVLIVGNAWHPQDLLHVLAESGQYYSARFPIWNKEGVCTWPEAWSEERIEKKRVELGPVEFARQLLCKVRDDAAARFRKGDIDAACAKGSKLKLVTSLAGVAGSVDGELPEGCQTFTGVDLAMSMKKKSDDTVFFTFMEDEKGNRTLLNIEIGKFTGGEIVAKIIDHHHRYKSTIAVESNAAQKFILDFATEGTNLPIVPHLTTRAKRDPLIGVESLSIELANGKWIIPSMIAVAPNVERWIREMLFYSPHTHVGDALMASYFAREVARRLMGNKGGNGSGVVFRALGTDAGKKPQGPKTMEDFGARVVAVPMISDEAAYEKDRRGSARD